MAWYAPVDDPSPESPQAAAAVSLHVELPLRIAVATALAAVIGLERQIHRSPAGLRTHMLVVLASSSSWRRRSGRPPTGARSVWPTQLAVRSTIGVA